MAEAKTKAKTEEKKPESREVAAFRTVESWLVDNSGELSARLPKHINRDRFQAVALEAVRQNPKLLACTPRSLFNAFRKAAADGILPDGREGVITPYKDEAQWNPMIFGLRKRARELDDLIVDAQVVYANDHFIWHQGDDPKLEHTPAPLGQVRGGMIGAYAIFKRHGEILHREVMDVNQIKTVQSQSRKPDSLMWVKFPEEAWRKVVARRGFKSVPSLSEKLDAIVRSGDDEFEFPDAPPPVKHPVAERPRDVKSMLDQFGSGTVIEGEAVETPHGNIRLDADASYDELNTFIDGLPSKDVPGNFIEYIESWRVAFPMMTQEHQRIAIEKLEEAACEALGTEEAAKLPRLP
jgi:phage RecT family recombinase